jgi:choline kinase
MFCFYYLILRSSLQIEDQKSKIRQIQVSHNYYRTNFYSLFRASSMSLCCSIAIDIFTIFSNKTFKKFLEKHTITLCNILKDLGCGRIIEVKCA